MVSLPKTKKYSSIMNPLRLLTKEAKDDMKDEDATKKEDLDDGDSHMKAGGPDKKKQMKSINIFHSRHNLDLQKSKVRL